MNVHCPVCDASHTATNDLVGRSTRCQMCGHRFTIPAKLATTDTLPSVVPAEPARNRVESGLNALGGFVGFLAVGGLIVAGWLASEERLTPAVAVFAGVVSLWLWWVSVSLTVRVLLDIERNTRN